MTPLLRLGLATLILHLLLIQPNHPDAMTWGALLLFPLELPVILLVLIALPPGSRWTFWLRLTGVAVLMLIALFKLADYIMFMALSRAFNPLADLPLIEAGLRLATGAIGPLLTLGAILASVMLIAAVTAALWWATNVWSGLKVSPAQGRGLTVIAGLFAAIGIAEIGQAMGRWSLPLSPPGAAFTARVGLERVDMIRSTLDSLRTFKAAVATDPYTANTEWLAAIDRDVLIIFVESYGRTSLDTPFYADVHGATLKEAEARLRDLGLSMRSGLLQSPTRGGQSWLSHATLANGLWVAGQTQYAAVLSSGRRSLFHIASDRGFRTAAVMPQITLDWPESDSMGFETVLAAQDLGYAGEPFNWVTMPDQFTLTALDRLLRNSPDDRPLLAQIALGSSHAPWVPVPVLLPWEAIGDGRVFNPMARSGDSPDQIWRDPDRVREQYRQAIDYALGVVFDYAARHADDPPLIFVIGDHQAASFVAMDNRDHVPIHVIGPEALVAPTEDWGWSDGLIPDPETEVRPMDQLRALILETYTPQAQPSPHQDQGHPLMLQQVRLQSDSD